MDNVLGAVAQLPRVKLQRGGMPIEQPPEKLGPCWGRSCWSRSRSPSLRRRPTDCVPRDPKKFGPLPEWGVPRPQLHPSKSVHSRPRSPPRIMEVVALPRQQLMNRNEIIHWLRETDPDRLAQLWRLADRTRQEHVGGEVHLRGLVELSNHCVRLCGYCGLRRAMPAWIATA